MGLFGWDMTDFWSDCKLAATGDPTNCDYDTLYTNYDGWAVGAYA